MKLFFALTLLAFGQLSAQKKDTLLILPGSKFIQSDKLHDYTAAYDFFSDKNGEEKLVGSINVRFEIKGKKNGLLVCTIVFGANNIVDSGLCKLPGLAPVYHRSVQTKKNLSLTFSKEKTVGKVLFKNTEGSRGTEDKIEHKTPTPLFDSYYEDIIAKTINVEKGAIFRFAEYIYERSGTVWELGEVLNGENASERIVKFYELNDKKEIVRTTVYIIDESTRDIIRREYITSSNKIIMKKKRS